MQPSSPYLPSESQADHVHPGLQGFVGDADGLSFRPSSMSLVLLRMRSLSGISERAARPSMKMGMGSYWRRSILLKMFRPLSSETSFSEERPPMMIPTLGFRAVFASPVASI